MSRWSTARSTRVRLRVDLEVLEPRKLMVASVGTLAATQVYLWNNGAPVSQFSDAAEVTLKRSGNLNASIQVVVSTEASSPPINVANAVAGQDYTPIRELVTFAAGEDTKTVSIPLIAGASGPGERSLPILVTPVSAGVVGVFGTLKLVDRVDVTPAVDRELAAGPPDGRRRDRLDLQRADGPRERRESRQLLRHRDNQPRSESPG